MNLSIMSTDSQELLCELHTKDSFLRAFWIPEDGSLRMWGQNKPITGVANRRAVKRTMLQLIK